MMLYVHVVYRLGIIRNRDYYSMYFIVYSLYYTAVIVNLRSDKLVHCVRKIAKKYFHEIRAFFHNTFRQCE